MNDHAPNATFRSMEESTAQDWQAIGAHFMPFASGVADRVLTHLKLLDGDYGGFPIDRLQHSLQTATRAHRGGESEPYVVAALLHDIGDTLASYNHPDVAAAILKPFVDEKTHWMVEHHGIFQGYYFFHHIGLDRHLRDQFAGHEHYERTAEFCELYDNPAFDPKAETLPMSEFEPIVRRVFAQPKNSIYKAATPVAGDAASARAAA
jgi:predicted HD phosphohydrolase